MKQLQNIIHHGQVDIGQNDLTEILFTPVEFQIKDIKHLIKMEEKGVENSENDTVAELELSLDRDLMEPKTELCENLIDVDTKIMSNALKQNRSRRNRSFGEYKNYQYI